MATLGATYFDLIDLYKSQEPDGSIALGRLEAEHTIPNSYFLPSNGILEFIEHNDLDELINVKYKTSEEVRDEFPLVERLFKSGTFPPTIHKGLEEMLLRGIRWTAGLD